MFRDHIFFKEIGADGQPIANFEGSVILDETEIIFIRNNMIARGIVGQSASNKNADGDEYKRIAVCDIMGTREHKRRIGRRFTVLEMADGREYFINFWHREKALPVLEEILAAQAKRSEEAAAALDDLTDEEKALLQKLADRGLIK